MAFWESSSSGGGPDGTLKKIAVMGGTAVAISKLTEPFGASWAPDDQILIGAGPNGVQRVSAAGGTPETIISVNPGELASSPQILPDGEHVLFTLGEQTLAIDPTRRRNWDLAQIVVQSLKSGARKVLIKGGSDARYLPTGHIVYAQASTLWARPFDLSRLQVIGEPASLVEGVSTAALGQFTTGAAQFSFSGTGSMAYVTGTEENVSPPRSLALIDLSGRVKLLDLPAGPYHGPRFSLPDGKQIALYTSDGVIWTYDLSGAKPIRKLTLEGSNRLPAWTRDGRVVFGSVSEGRAGLFWQRADGSTPAERMIEPDARSYLPDSVSPDGKTLFLRRQAVDVEREIVTLSLDSDRTPKPLPYGPKGLLFSPTLSPDGRWLAYEWTGNVYVEPFPPTGARYLVTTDGGSNPMWSSDGRRLIYVRERRDPVSRRGRATFYSVDVLGEGPSFESGRANELFSMDGLFIAGSGPGNYIDLSPDGKQFVTLLLPPQPSSGSEQDRVHVVVNWFADVQQRVEVK